MPSPNKKTSKSPDNQLVVSQRSIAEGALVEKRLWHTPKDQWGDGPWQDEPDEYFFTHRDLPCFNLRNGGGSWCGYVELPSNHPWRKLKDTEVRADVHGGVTWLDDISFRAPFTKFAFVVGFDCAHASDLRPADEALFGNTTRTRVPGFQHHYRPLEYVINETKNLADQVLSAIEDTANPRRSLKK